MSHVVGGSALGGIGFTVSLFNTGLAFTCATLQTQVKICILAGSLLAALAGVATLLRQAAPSGAEVVSVAGGIH